MTSIAEHVEYFRKITNLYAAQTVDTINRYRITVAAQIQDFSASIAANIKNAYAWGVSLINSEWLKQQALWLLNKFIAGFWHGYNAVLIIANMTIQITREIIAFIKYIPKLLVKLLPKLWNAINEAIVILKDGIVNLLNQIANFLSHIRTIGAKIISNMTTAIGVIFGVSAAIVDIAFDLMGFVYNNTLGLVLPTLPNIPLLTAALPFIKGALTFGLVTAAGYGVYKAGHTLYKQFEPQITQAKNQLTTLLKKVGSELKNGKKENLTFAIGTLHFMSVMGFVLEASRLKKMGLSMSSGATLLGALCVGSFSAIYGYFLYKDIKNEKATNKQENTDNTPRHGKKLSNDHSEKKVPQLTKASATVTPLRTLRSKTRSEAAKAATESVVDKRKKRAKA